MVYFLFFLGGVWGVFFYYFFAGASSEGEPCRVQRVETYMARRGPSTGRQVGLELTLVAFCVILLSVGCFFLFFQARAPRVSHVGFNELNPTWLAM